MFSKKNTQYRKAASAIEYGIIAGAIAVVILGGVAATGVNLANLFGGFGNTVSSIVAGSSSTSSVATSPSAFSQLVYQESSLYKGGCNSTMTAFNNSVGEALSTIECSSNNTGESEALVLSDPLLQEKPTISSSVDGPVTIPALEGANTGFTLPGGSSDAVTLFTGQGYYGASFAISSINPLNSGNTGNASAACAAEGGQMYYLPSMQSPDPYADGGANGAYGALCTGAVYPSSSVQTLINGG